MRYGNERWEYSRMSNFVEESEILTLFPVLSRVLYGNRISVLPPGLFHGLTSLQLL